MLIVMVSGWAVWQLELKPKTKDQFIQKEISIEQAELPEVEMTTYDDWAGFKFKYPSILEVIEVEVDNPDVYSALEIKQEDGQKISLRISDTEFKSLDEFKTALEKNNVLLSIEGVYWADMQALRITLGVPKKMLTAAIDSNIMYQVSHESDDGGFWDQAHIDLIDSFEFSNIEAEKSTEKPTKEDEEIVLLEEIVE